MKRIFVWLGTERGNRTIASAAIILGVITAGPVFIYQHVLPTFFPAFEASDYGRGYRSGSRINHLENENAELRAVVRASQIGRQVDAKIDAMTDEELDAALHREGWLREDEPSRPRPVSPPAAGR
jgi:hypothetical protein